MEFFSMCRIITRYFPYGQTSARYTLARLPTLDAYQPSDTWSSQCMGPQRQKMNHIVHVLEIESPLPEARPFKVLYTATRSSEKVQSICSKLSGRV